MLQNIINACLCDYKHTKRVKIAIINQIREFCQSRNGRKKFTALFQFKDSTDHELHACHVCEVPLDLAPLYPDPRGMAVLLGPAPSVVESDFPRATCLPQGHNLVAFSLAADQTGETMAHRHDNSRRCVRLHALNLRRAAVAEILCLTKKACLMCLHRVTVLVQISPFQNLVVQNVVFLDLAVWDVPFLGEARVHRGTCRHLMAFAVAETVSRLHAVHEKVRTKVVPRDN